MSSVGEDLLRSAREALDIAQGRSEPAFVFVPETVDVAAIRQRQGLSQARFARTYGLAPSAVRDWEQKRRTPDRTARVLLTVIDRHPDAVTAALAETAAE